MNEHLVVLRARQLLLVPIQRPLVPQIEEHDQDAVEHEPLRPEAQRPVERDALQVAEQQRGVAEGREQAAAVGHNKDEEDDDVGDALAALVGAEQRPDQQDGRAGRTQQVGEHRADAEHPGVDERRARE